MTHLDHPVVRRTLTRHRGRHLVVSLLPGDVIAIRELRGRKDYTLPLAHVFDTAVKAEVAAQRRAKGRK